MPPQLLGADGSLVVPPQRFCTEFVLRLPDVVEGPQPAVTTELLQQRLGELGDSVVAVVAQGHAKVHIHT